jgi:hypothetical protein
MARTRTTTAHTTTTGRKPSLLSRLTGKKTSNARVTESTSRNPITGTTTTTRKTTTHPSGVGHHGHAGKGPLASKSTVTRSSATRSSTTRSKGVTTTGTHHHHHQRKPSMGDKISGGLMHLKGSLTGKPGVKVSCFVPCLIPNSF